MIRSAASKVMWVGRATVFLVGLAVILALVFGVATTALSATGGNFLLGQRNAADAVSTLVKQGPGPALSLVVGANQPPLKVNSAAKVANLNADKLDGIDSGALGIGVKKNHQRTAECDNISLWNACAPVTVKVPAGKTYTAMVWTDFSAVSSSTTDVRYCSGYVPPAGGLQCMDVDSQEISLAADYAESASSMGDIINLTAGTYTFSTMIAPEASISNGIATTRVLVTDQSVPDPPVQ